MALEPELFPGVLEPAFVRSAELEELIVAVRDAFPEFRDVVEAMDEGGITIGYVFETKPFDALHEEYKPHTIAKVSKASPLWREWGSVDAIIQFRRTFWTAFDEQQRRAVAYHELKHLDLSQDDKGRWTLALRHHEIEEFSGVMRHFGPIIPGRKQFLDSAMAWVHEQEHGEPTPLRSLSERALDMAVDDINAGAMGPNVSASRPARPADPIADRLSARLGTKRKP